MFTRHMWLMLTPEVFKGIRPHPNSLQEAMRCWTITSVDDTLAAVTFEACNAGLHDRTGITPGRMGPRSKAFADRCSLFFPDAGASNKDKAQWSVLWDADGYIAEFHRMMKTRDEDQQALLKQGLCDVFSHLHCLPASTARNRLYWEGAESYRRAPKARHAMKLIKGKCIFAADLMDSQPFDSDGNLRRRTERQKCREFNRKMTMAKKNKRVSPPPHPCKARPFPMDVIVGEDEQMDIDDAMEGDETMDIDEAMDID
ncbi:hypothetical protein BDR07DRAFT_1498420 [Suillus spraguei]|nr:hypothetical protein BDR07DRAFT_1498420 [Suillus spraguei]